MIKFLDKPLTVERVLAAYAKTGLKPRDEWYAIRGFGDERCGCAIGAVLLAEGCETFEALESDDFTHQDDTETPEIKSFIAGFDDLPQYNHEREAYELGQACRKAVGL